MASQAVSRAFALCSRHRSGADARQVVGSHPGAQRCAERFCAVFMEIVVEVATSRVQGQHYRAASAGTFGQALAGAPSGWISIAGDVEALEAWRQDERREVAGRQ